MARTITLAAQRGATLTRQLLAFARRQPLRPTRIDVNALIRDIDPILRRTLTSAIVIRTMLADDLRPCITDPAQLESAILNLAINARDAMMDNGHLTIDVANRDVAAGEIADLAAGRYVLIAVTDVGHGMSAEVRAKAVQPFFTTKETGKGSGLGLSMVYGFVKQSGGHMEIDSTVGRGTAVRLMLPVAAGHLRTRPAGAADADEARLQGGSVLVVDDDPGVLSVAVSLLESLGYRVTTAVDGASALHWINEGGPFDLLLTDIVLPGGMNGVQLAAAALRMRSEIKVLLMSGYAEHALDEKSFPALLLHKPFRRKDLADKLRQTFAA
jgi:CheY-like chemotaxis protein